MPLHVEFGRGQQLGHVVALVEGVRFLDLRCQICRHGRAGFVVFRVVWQTPSDRCAQCSLNCEGNSTKSRAVAVPESVGYWVSANMPCRPCPNSWNMVITSSKLIRAGSPGAGLGKFATLIDDRLLAQQVRLVDEVRHPGSAVLVVALEVVAVEQREVLAVGVEDLEHAHIRVVDRKVVALFESEAVELVRSVEDAILQHVVELEIGLDLRIVEIVPGFANLLGVEVPVPGLELEAALLGVDHGLDIFRFLAALRSGGGHDRIHKLQRGFGSFGHLVFELPRGKAWEAEQLGLLSTKLRETRDGVARVVGVAAFGAVPGMLEDAPDGWRDW